MRLWYLIPSPPRYRDSLPSKEATIQAACAPQVCVSREPPNEAIVFNGSLGAIFNRATRDRTPEPT